jgi:hypothetical protein
MERAGASQKRTRISTLRYSSATRISFPFDAGRQCRSALPSWHASLILSQQLRATASLAVCSGRQPVAVSDNCCCSPPVLLGT